MKLLILYTVYVCSDCTSVDDNRMDEILTLTALLVLRNPTIGPNENYLTPIGIHRFRELIFYRNF